MLHVLATIVATATITKGKKKVNKIKLDVRHATKSQKVSERAVVLSKEEKYQNLPGQDFVDRKQLSMKSPLAFFVDS